MATAKYGFFAMRDYFLKIFNENPLFFVKLIATLLTRKEHFLVAGVNEAFFWWMMCRILQIP